MEMMNFQEMAAIRELTGDNQGGKWGQNTALWAIVAIIIVIAFLWWCHEGGKSKADLAASIQGLYGKVNAMEPIVARHTENLESLNSVTSATTQAVGDFKAFTNRQLAQLEGAVFTSRCADDGCGCNSSRFVKKSTFTPSTVEVTQEERCC